MLQLFDFSLFRMEKARQEKTKKRKQKKEILAARRAWKAKLRASAVSTPTTTSSIDQGEVSQKKIWKTSKWAPKKEKFRIKLSALFQSPSPAVK